MHRVELRNNHRVEDGIVDEISFFGGHSIHDMMFSVFDAQHQRLLEHPSRDIMHELCVARFHTPSIG